MGTLAEDAAKLRSLKADAARVTAKAKELTSEATEAELDLFERMDIEGVRGIKVGNTNFVPVETNYGTVQDRAAFIDWANENDPSLIEPRERKSLVNEIVREYLDSGDPLPPGLGFYTKSYISQRSSG